MNKNCFVEHAYQIDVKKCFASQKKSLQNIELFHLIDTWPWFFGLNSSFLRFIEACNDGLH